MKKEIISNILDVAFIAVCLFSFYFFTKKASIFKKETNILKEKEVSEEDNLGFVAPRVEHEVDTEKTEESTEKEVKDTEAEEKQTVEKTDAEEKKEEKDDLKEGDLEEEPVSSWEWLKSQSKLHQLEKEEINALLKEVHNRFPKTQDRLKAFSLLRLETPYVWGGLGEEKEKDNDPIFRLDITDCTSFVLTNTALLHAENWQEAREMMVHVNYHPEGEVSFEDRLHFTTDRNNVSFYFEDITKEVGKDKTKEEKIILNKIKDDGERLLDIDWEKEKTIYYIPSDHLTSDFLKTLPKSCGVAFLKENNFALGLDVSHEGFLFDGETLVHASSAYGEVVKVGFLDYYFQEDPPRFDGIVVFKVK